MKCLFGSLSILAFIVFSLSCSSRVEERDENTFSVARELSWYTINLHGKSHEITAFCEDLIDAIADIEGIKLEKVLISSGRSFQTLNKGEYNSILTISSKDDVIEDQYFFSDLFLNLGPVLVVRDDSKYRFLDDFHERLLGVWEGTTYAQKLEMNPSTVTRLYYDVSKAIDELIAGKIDGVALDLLAARRYAGGAYRERVKIVMPPLEKRGIRIVTGKNENDMKLIMHVNEGLKKLIGNGTYQRLLKKWKLDKEGVGVSEGIQK